MYKNTPEVIFPREDDEDIGEFTEEEKIALLESLENFINPKVQIIFTTKNSQFIDKMEQLFKSENLSDDEQEAFFLKNPDLMNFTADVEGNVYLNANIDKIADMEISGEFNLQENPIVIKDETSDLQMYIIFLVLGIGILLLSIRSYKRNGFQ
ncbi:hypothetical protein COB57_01815 [Candidatus Peregrinibacteria bacterium]|nr:MAG: hypothetical protein COB57_01815 [Candidatus Peregrinibacteria bacterium]